MLRVSATQSNAIYLTLLEKSSLANPYFTFVISNRASLDTYTFSPDNFSPSPYYDCFTISIGTPESLTGSNVTLNIAQGEYHYTVYDTPTQYSLSVTGSVCEVGIMKVIGTVSDATNYDNVPKIKTYKNI